MRPGRFACPKLWHRRVAIARQVAVDGGGIGDVAKAWGTSAALVSLRLRKHAPEVHADLKSNARSVALSPETVRERLQVIASSKTQAEAARTLNVTSSAIVGFLKRYAPFGVEDALQDYEEAA